MVSYNTNIGLTINKIHQTDGLQVHLAKNYQTNQNQLVTAENLIAYLTFVTNFEKMKANPVKRYQSDGGKTHGKFKRS